jgi:uncharacterized protein
MTWLLDGNALAALVIDSHDHHRRVFRWFDDQDELFATCAVTQGTLLRVHMMMAQERSSAAAWAALKRLLSHQAHRFWDAGFSYAEVSPRYLQGSRQVTDAWLHELARRRKSRIATLDAAFATLYPEVVLLIPA